MPRRAKGIGWHTQGVGAPPLVFPSSWLRLRGFKAEFRHILENINPRKIPGQFESRSLKLKKYTKQGFPVLQSYNQNKGDPLENPQKHLNT